MFTQFFIEVVFSLTGKISQAVEYLSDKLPMTLLSGQAIVNPWPKEDSMIVYSYLTGYEDVVSTLETIKSWFIISGESEILIKVSDYTGCFVAGSLSKETYDSFVMEVRERICKESTLRFFGAID